MPTRRSPRQWARLISRWPASRCTLTADPVHRPATVDTEGVVDQCRSPSRCPVSAIRVGEDETVEVGVELAVIDEGGTGAAPAQEAPAQGQPAEEQAADS